MLDIVIKKSPNKEFEKSVACIGFFDGLHKGHRALIYKTIADAKKKGIKSSVICFDPDPYDVISGKKQKHIYSHQFRKIFFEKLGIDIVYTIKFNKDLMKISPIKFINEYLNKMNLSELLCGEDFSFGSKGKGNTYLLKQKGNFKTIVVKDVKYKGKKISSTTIKNALIEGDLELVNKLLGYSYVCITVVTKCIKDGKKYLVETKPYDKNILLPAVEVYGKDFEMKRNRIYIRSNKSVATDTIIGLTFDAK